MLLKIIIRNKWFFLPYFVIVILIIMALLHFSKAGIHIFFNRYYSDFADVFFSYITNPGNGIFLPLFILIMLFFSIRYSILMVLGFLASGLVVQLIKHLVLYDSLRPSKYFENIYPLHLVNGIQQLNYHSFPSGHSATAFCVFLCFALISGNNLVKLIMLVFASIIAYSRVYLSQHFMIDILAGSLIGVIVTLIIYLWINTLTYSWLNKKIMIFKTNTIV